MKIALNYDFVPAKHATKKELQAMNDFVQFIEPSQITKSGTYIHGNIVFMRVEGKEGSSVAHFLTKAYYEKELQVVDLLQENTYCVEYKTNINFIYQGTKKELIHLNTHNLIECNVDQAIEACGGFSVLMSTFEDDLCDDLKKLKTWYICN